MIPRGTSDSGRKSESHITCQLGDELPTAKQNCRPVTDITENYANIPVSGRFMILDFSVDFFQLTLSFIQCLIKRFTDIFSFGGCNDLMPECIHSDFRHFFHMFTVQNDMTGSDFIKIFT